MQHRSDIDRKFVLSYLNTYQKIHAWTAEKTIPLYLSLTTEILKTSSRWLQRCYRGIILGSRWNVKYKNVRSVVQIVIDGKLIFRLVVGEKVSPCSLMDKAGLF
jgi:hypothetical protein